MTSSRCIFQGHLHQPNHISPGAKIPVRCMLCRFLSPVATDTRAVLRVVSSCLNLPLKRSRYSTAKLFVLVTTDQLTNLSRLSASRYPARKPYREIDRRGV